jgi:NADH-quinone oxidoreductase subunit L
MAIPLILLAIGAVIAGYVGVPHALGGHNRIESFLEPAFHAGVESHSAQDSGLTAQGHDTPAPGAGSHAPDVLTPVPEHAAEGDHAADTKTELALMGLSSLIAFLGIGIAAFLFLKRPRKANLHPAGVHKLLVNKYYVDELYDAVIVRPIHALSSSVLWKGIDARVIDGAVNGTGTLIRAGSSGLRRLQTGSVRAYAMGTFAGVVAMLGYYLWR